MRLKAKSNVIDFQAFGNVLEISHGKAYVKRICGGLRARVPEAKGVPVRVNDTWAQSFFGRPTQNPQERHVGALLKMKLAAIVILQ